MRTTGLPLSAHDGASKIRWLLRNSPGVSTTWQLAASLLAAFLLHQLTQGSTFAIDVTNAARATCRPMPMSSRSCRAS